MMLIFHGGLYFLMLHEASLSLIVLETGSSATLVP